jgi:hypothetical protein
MTEELLRLVESVRQKKVSQEERAKQRLNFAFGNGAEEAEIVSKHSLKQADKIVRSQMGPGSR